MYQVLWGIQGGCFIALLFSQAAGLRLEIHINHQRTYSLFIHHDIIHGFVDYTWWNAAVVTLSVISHVALKKIWYLSLGP